RRAQYQFGPFLAKGVRGHVDCGLGKTMAAGAVALLRPTDLIIATGDKRVIDGLEFEFQMAPNSEAPAEMHFYVARHKLLNLAENCTHNFHNLLPFRGADVRDALAWSKYLGEALQMWGGKADAMCGQHHWPVWGSRDPGAGGQGFYQGRIPVCRAGREPPGVRRSRQSGGARDARRHVRAARLCLRKFHLAQRLSVRGAGVAAGYAEDAAALDH